MGTPEVSPFGLPAPQTSADAAADLASCLVDRPGVRCHQGHRDQPRANGAETTKSNSPQQEARANRGDLPGAGRPNSPRSGDRRPSWRITGRWTPELATMRKPNRIVAIYGALDAGSRHEAGPDRHRGELRGARRPNSPRSGPRRPSWRTTGRWTLQVATMQKAANVVAIYGALDARSRHDLGTDGHRGELRGARRPNSPRSGPRRPSWRFKGSRTPQNARNSPRCGPRWRSWRITGHWTLQVATMRKAAHIVAIYGALDAPSRHDLGLDGDRGELRCWTPRRVSPYGAISPQVRKLGPIARPCRASGTSPPTFAADGPAEWRNSTGNNPAKTSTLEDPSATQKGKNGN